MPVRKKQLSPHILLIYLHLSTHFLTFYSLKLIKSIMKWYETFFPLLMVIIKVKLYTHTVDKTGISSAAVARLSVWTLYECSAQVEVSCVFKALGFRLNVLCVVEETHKTLDLYLTDSFPLKLNKSVSLWKRISENPIETWVCHFFSSSNAATNTCFYWGQVLQKYYFLHYFFTKVQSVAIRFAL